VAFVPDPTPEALELDAGALQALTTAERELGQLTGLLRGMGTDLNVHLLSRPFLRQEAVASSRIEGTVTTPEQLVLLEVEGGDATASGPASETREVLNYMETLEHGFGRLKDLPVCVRFIKELHAILMRGVRGDEERPGEIRTVQKFIGKLLKRSEAAPRFTCRSYCFACVSRRISRGGGARNRPSRKGGRTRGTVEIPRVSSARFPREGTGSDGKRRGVG
jgi:hypothetical protein